MGLVVGLPDHVEVAGDDGHMFGGVQEVDEVHGGGAGVDVQGVAVLDELLGAPGHPALLLGPELGALGEQGRLLPLDRPDASVNFFHRAGAHQVGHVGPDGVHGDAEGVPQLFHGDGVPLGHQGLDPLAPVVLHPQRPLSAPIKNFRIPMITPGEKIVNCFMEIGKFTIGGRKLLENLHLKLTERPADATISM